MIKHISASGADRLERYGYVVYRGKRILLGKPRVKNLLEDAKTGLYGIGFGVYLLSLSPIILISSLQYLLPSVALIERDE